MSTHNNRFPFTPYPFGIFAVAFSHEIQPEKVYPMQFMGEKIALFRTKNGDVGALSAYCPHLGANLTSGVVKNERLKCPFHGLAFDINGKSCAKNRAGLVGTHRAKCWRTFENYGLIFLIHERDQNDCSIHFPIWDQSEWSKPISYSFKIRSHPQEILENTVDRLHFFEVHHYARIQNQQPSSAKATEFIAQYQIERSNSIFGFLDRKKLEMNLKIHAYGLGLSMVDVTLPKYNIALRQLVLPTPIDEEFVYIRTLTSVKMPLLSNKMLPTKFKKILANALNKLVAKHFLKDFLPDLHIWESKQYIENPNYLLNDGEFELYRNWASQFY